MLVGSLSKAFVLGGFVTTLDVEIDAQDEGWQLCLWQAGSTVYPVAGIIAVCDIIDSPEYDVDLKASCTR